MVFGILHILAVFNEIDAVDHAAINRIEPKFVYPETFLLEWQFMYECNSKAGLTGF